MFWRNGSHSSHTLRCMQSKLYAGMRYARDLSQTEPLKTPANVNRAEVDLILTMFWHNYW